MTNQTPVVDVTEKCKQLYERGISITESFETRGKLGVALGMASLAYSLAKELSEEQLKTRALEAVKQLSKKMAEQPDRGEEYLDQFCSIVNTSITNSFMLDVFEAKVNTLEQMLQSS